MTSSLLTRIILALLGLGVVLVPIDGLRGPAALGELGSLACFPPFAIAVCLSTYSVTFSGIRVAGGSLMIGAGAMAIVAVSALANLPTISQAVFHDRSGFTKFATSLLVLGYGFCLAAAVESQPLKHVVRTVTPGIAISAGACIVFGLFEYASKHGFPSPIYSIGNHLLHSSDSPVNSWDGSLNLKWIYGWDARLRALSFEPPAFGNFTGFAWPWLVYGAAASQRSARAAYLALLLLFTGLIVVSEARTGWLMLAVNCAVMVTLRLIYFTRSQHPLLAFARLSLPACSIAAMGLFALRTS